MCQEDPNIFYLFIKLLRMPKVDVSNHFFNTQKVKAQRKGDGLSWKGRLRIIEYSLGKNM